MGNEVITLVPNSGFGLNIFTWLSGVILINPVSSTQSILSVAAAIASLGIKLANQLNPIIIPPPVKEVTFRNERLL